jgi:hypothetical protein
MSKEKKPTSAPVRDPEIKFDRSTFFQNRLALPEALKAHLNAQGLDFRFLNAGEFRKNGNRHQSHWRPFEMKEGYQALGLTGVTPEGLVQVGDLILGVREKQISKAHKEFLAERNRVYSGNKYNKEKAKELRALAKTHGVSDETEIHEGFEDND